MLQLENSGHSFMIFLRDFSLFFKEFELEFIWYFHPNAGKWYTFQAYALKKTKKLFRLKMLENMPFSAEKAGKLDFKISENPA